MAKSAGRVAKSRDEWLSKESGAGGHTEMSSSLADQ